MKKLISYEYRNNKKEFNKLLLILVVASTLFQLSMIFGVTRDNSFIFSKIKNIEFILPMIYIISMISVIFIVIISIVYFVKLANILKKDIYEGQSYIIFSLPVNGKQIIGSKYLIGVFYSLIMPVLLLIYNIILFSILVIISNLIGGTSWNEIYQAINEILSTHFVDEIFRYIFNFKNILLSTLQSLIASLLIVSIIFAAVVTDWNLSNVKKNSSIWILYAIGFIFVWGFIKSYIGLNTVMVDGIFINNNTLNVVEFIRSVDSLDYYIQYFINIFLDLVVVIGLYFYTSFIFSKKIEI